MIRVLMVCTGNICRSAMAHQVLAEAVAEAGLDVEVDSAGVSDEEEGNPIDPRAARVLREAGHGVPDRRARRISPAEMGSWDLVLAMTDRHRRILNAFNNPPGSSGPVTDVRMFRDFDPEATRMDLDLPDPWYGGHDDFVETLAVIERTTPYLAGHLRSLTR
ncbi:low molecular weight protein-tyrosine-phosphatase [Actinomyces mediterranea]|uniref:low molecular weight protein-tyrosine-phosphatase n=1 Tax=Actinomyces mediterranea TaxID=1871028 RepID=UPI001967047C|nr:low molecular weight protein-tyrosine-phosphatase [Actinomyces mediterranea]